jgi:hypothetical protein
MVSGRRLQTETTTSSCCPAGAVSSFIQAGRELRASSSVSVDFPRKLQMPASPWSALGCKLRHQPRRQGCQLRRHPLRPVPRAATSGFDPVAFCWHSSPESVCSARVSRPRAGSQIVRQQPANMQAGDAKQVPAAWGPRISTNAAFVRPSGPLKANSGRASSEPVLGDAHSTVASSTAATGSPNGRKQSKATTREVTKGGISGTTKNRSPVRQESKRYSRRNSNIMRLFCQGSGRATPECRTFLREARRSRR